MNNTEYLIVYKTLVYKIKNPTEFFKNVENIDKYLVEGFDGRLSFVTTFEDIGDYIALHKTRDFMVYNKTYLP